MVKTPKARHSKTKRDPVTIDLDPASVTRVTDEPAASVAKGAAADADEGAAAREELEAPAASTADTGATDNPSTDETDAVEERAWAERDAETEEAASAASARVADEQRAREEEEREQEMRAADMAPVPSSGGGAGTAILGGLVGAILALLLAGGLQLAGVLPPLSQNGGNGDEAALRQDVSDLKGQIAELKNNPPAAPSGGDTDGLGQRVDELDKSLASLQQSVSGIEGGQKSATDASADMDGLKAQIGELQKKVDATSQSATTASDLQQRVTQLEQGVSEARSDAGQSDVNAERIAALQDQVKQLGEKLSAEAQKPGVEKLVAATALKSAVDRGVGFAGELQAYGQLAGGTDDLQALQKYADKGVPTRAQLSEQASDVASQMVRAANVDSGDDSLFGRLRDSAASLVVVRPVGQVEGDDVASVAARFEADVKAGDYAKALEEYAKLPDESKQAGADFAEQLKARAAADRLLDQALTGALKAE